MPLHGCPCGALEALLAVACGSALFPSSDVVCCAGRSVPWSLPSCRARARAHCLPNHAISCPVMFQLKKAVPVASVLLAPAVTLLWPLSVTTRLRPRCGIMWSLPSPVRLTLLRLFCAPPLPCPLRWATSSSGSSSALWGSPSACCSTTTTGGCWHSRQAASDEGQQAGWQAGRRGAPPPASPIVPPGWMPWLHSPCCPPPSPCHAPSCDSSHQPGSSAAPQLVCTAPPLTVA